MLNTKCASLNIKSNSGDVELSNVLVIGELKLESSTGDVKLDSFDAGNIYIKTSTGDVKGTILSEKIFVVKTSSGSAIYPETFSGGVCKIETSSGSVNISYK